MGGVGFALRGGAILAVTDGADVAAAGAEPDQVLPDGGGALFAQGQVVLGRAAVSITTMVRFTSMILSHPEMLFKVSA